MFEQTVDRCVMASPIGKLIISTTADDAVSGVSFAPPRSGTAVSSHTPSSAIAKRAVKQLELYFGDPRWRFDLKLALEGTDFQRKVWANLLRMRAGQTLTYGVFAKRIRTGPRAVGNACGRNPIPIIIPCHRIIAADGSLGGFCRDGKGKFMLDKKRWLLAHEQE